MRVGEDREAPEGDLDRLHHHPAAARLRLLDRRVGVLDAEVDLPARGDLRGGVARLEVQEAADRALAAVGYDPPVGLVAGGRLFEAQAEDAAVEALGTRV